MNIPPLGGTGMCEKTLDENAEKTIFCTVCDDIIASEATVLNYSSLSTRALLPTRYYYITTLHNHARQARQRSTRQSQARQQRQSTSIAINGQQTILDAKNSRTNKLYQAKFEN